MSVRAARAGSQQLTVTSFELVDAIVHDETETLRTTALLSAFETLINLTKWGQLFADRRTW